MGWVLIIETETEKILVNRGTIDLVFNISEKYEEAKELYQKSRQDLFAFALMEKSKIGDNKDTEEEIGTIWSVVKTWEELIGYFEESYRELLYLEEIKKTLEEEKVKVHSEVDNKYYIKDKNGFFVEVKQEEYEKYLD